MIKKIITYLPKLNKDELLKYHSKQQAQVLKPCPSFTRTSLTCRLSGDATLRNCSA